MDSSTALLATPAPYADRCMREMRQDHEGEMFSQPYNTAASRATSSAIASRPVPAFADVRDASLAPALVMPPAELCDGLYRAVYEAAGREAESMNKLRVAVRQFTIALRDIGTPPEHVLIALKAVVNNRSRVAIAPHVSDWNGDDLREKISTWCIHEFFAE